MINLLKAIGTGICSLLIFALLMLGVSAYPLVAAGLMISAFFVAVVVLAKDHFDTEVKND